MKLEQSFEVAAPVERVWAALIDVQRVATCLPGAAVTGRNDDGSYSGTFKVKIGPTSAAYSGKLFVENVDEQAHTATINASGTDKRGQGGAKATIVSLVTEGEAGATKVEVVTDYHITGRLARFGRGGMIEEISNRLLGQFATSLQTTLADGEENPAPSFTADAPAAAADAPGATHPSGDTPAPGPAPAAAASPLGPLQPAVKSEPVEGLSRMGSILLQQPMRNPASIAALLIGFLVALRVLRRR